MELLGTIEPGDEHASDKAQWAELIDAHPQLLRASATVGINPFTKQPMEIKPNPYHCAVQIKGREVGAIHWAMDDSRRLIVRSDVGSEMLVRPVAEEIAAKLGWHFVGAR